MKSRICVNKDKSIAIVILLLLFFKITEAQQTWSSAGATWHYNYYTQLSLGYLKIEKTNDTVIKGILCDKYTLSHHVFTGMSGLYSHDTSYVYSYMRGDTLYFSQDSVFKIYAIFSAQIGDTISTDMIPSIGCGSNHFTVDSLGYTLVMNDTLKVLYLTPTVVGYATLPLRLIEKIGYDQQMFEPWPCYVDMPFASPIRCYSDNSGFVFNNNTAPTCNYILDLDKNNSVKTEITLFPNPASNEFKLVYSAFLSDNTLLSIFDEYGKEVLTQKIITRSTSINTNNLSNSMYFYRVTNGGEILKQGRFTIEKF